MSFNKEEAQVGAFSGRPLIWNSRGFVDNSSLETGGGVPEKLILISFCISDGIEIHGMLEIFVSEFM